MFDFEEGRGGGHRTWRSLVLTMWVHGDPDPVPARPGVVRVTVNGAVQDGVSTENGPSYRIVGPPLRRYHVVATPECASAGVRVTETGVADHVFLKTGLQYAEDFFALFWR